MVDLQGDLAEKVAEEIRKTGGKARAIELNVAIFTPWSPGARDVRRTADWTYVPIMLAWYPGSILSIPHGGLEQILDTNLRGVIMIACGLSSDVKQKLAHYKYALWAV